MFVLNAILSAAMAHGTHSGDTVELHEGYDHDSCYIDLHPELSSDAFRTFAHEFSSAGGFDPMAGARPLGQGHVQAGITMRKTFIDDTKPAWNHTFSHPGDDHFLGSPMLPILQARVGLTERVDAEVMLTGDPSSNWGVVAGAARVAVLVEGEAVPVSAAARVSVVHLLGAPELGLEAIQADALVSRRLGPITPYAGLSERVALALEQTDELDLGPAVVTQLEGLAGLELVAWKLKAGVEGRLGPAPSASLFVGASF